MPDMSTVVPHFEIVYHAHTYNDAAPPPINNRGRFEEGHSLFRARSTSVAFFLLLQPITQSIQRVYTPYTQSFPTCTTTKQNDIFFFFSKRYFCKNKTIERNLVLFLVKNSIFSLCLTFSIPGSPKKVKITCRVRSQFSTTTLFACHNRRKKMGCDANCVQN